MIKLNNAKDTLLDPVKRSEYDVILNESRVEVCISPDDSAVETSSKTLEVFEIEDEPSIDYEGYKIEFELDDDPEVTLGSEVIDDTDIAFVVEPEKDAGLDSDDSGTLHPVAAADGQIFTEDSIEPSGGDKQVFAFCPNCGTENAEKADYCNKCNIRLIYFRQSEPDGTISSGPDHGLDTSQEYTQPSEGSIIACPNCGARNHRNSEYCYFCNVNLRYYRGRVVSPRPMPQDGLESQIPREYPPPPREEDLRACPNCGAGNLEGSTFCRICQTELKLLEKTRAAQGMHGEYGAETESAYSSLVVCPNCGAGNFRDSPNCHFCHASLVVYQPPISSPNPKAQPDAGAVTEPRKASSSKPEADSDSNTGKTSESPDSVTLECPNCEREVFPEQSYCYYCGHAFPKYIKTKK